ncbi:MAG: hypothetical protein ACLP4W_09295 [Mycobacterium sp.]|uniref:hypothetical protein n=1 Tax=Mycobacterium sp. TaxID=1785 RepID=UPI003F9952EE
MDQEGPEARIAELERQLAQQKRIAELESQLADAKAAAGVAQPVEQPSPVRLAQALQAQRELRRAPFSVSPRRFIGADRAGGIVGLIGGAIGLCVGGAAAVTALIPSSALWMSGIVCSSGYQMAYNTSHYSYRPGQSGTNVSFQCVGDADSYDVNDFAVFALQSLLAAVVLVVAAAVAGLIWRRSHKPS